MSVNFLQWARENASIYLLILLSSFLLLCFICGFSIVITCKCIWFISFSIVMHLQYVFIFKSKYFYVNRRVLGAVHSDIHTILLIQLECCLCIGLIYFCFHLSFFILNFHIRVAYQFVFVSSGNKNLLRLFSCVNITDYF